MFQDSKEGRLFCEFSTTQLRQLQGIYRNFTSTTGSEDPGSNGEFYIMPKLQKLLCVLKEYGNSRYCGEKFQCQKSLIMNKTGSNFFYHFVNNTRITGFSSVIAIPKIIPSPPS